MLIKVYIGIGSNLDNPLQQVIQAKQALAELSYNKQIVCSANYLSTPMGDIEQPDYVNAVVCITIAQSTTSTVLTQALELLHQLQLIENNQHRERNTHWGSRTLDLDLLLYDNEVIEHRNLKVPHDGLKQRNFVICPLADIAIDLVLPDGTRVKELYENCSLNGISKIE
ncbi:2-amino-4-hydroxy-6-hydroxymethyldihydropteridine diphosphokinase [Candidatus Dependentiae bacterium]|nr:MAG: 2-amino-4-hydroxy-6-hydroxymethyldihydropteridine diphosphokinase [Candidatus Dependentiae bacterium]